MKLLNPLQQNVKRDRLWFMYGVKHTCCLIVENSGWLEAITALNMRGGMPSCFWKIEHEQ